MTQKDLAQKGAGQINAFLEESKLNKAQAKKDEEARIFAQNHPDPTKEEEGLVDPLAMFTPLASDVVDVDRAIGSALEGDWGGAALGMVAAVPIVGDAAKAAIKASKKPNKVDAPVNLQKTISEYDATWDKFEEIDDVAEWQATVRKHVSEKRVDNPDVKTPELEESARQLSELKITREEHLANVDKYKPVREWTAVPREPSNKTIVFSLNDGQRTKGSFVFGSAAAKSLGVQKSALSIGDNFNGRLDITAYKAYDTWVVAGTSKGLGGTHYAKAIHYKGTDGGPVKFIASQKTGERIGKGEKPKTPYATVSGVIKDLDPDAIRKKADELLNDPEWIQVGFDPRRQGAFYVRGGENSGMAVLEADEVIQVGALLLAKKAVLDPTKKNFNQGGLVDAEMETRSFFGGGDSGESPKTMAQDNGIESVVLGKDETLKAAALRTGIPLDSLLKYNMQGEGLKKEEAPTVAMSAEDLYANMTPKQKAYFGALKTKKSAGTQVIEKASEVVSDVKEAFTPKDTGEKGFVEKVGDKLSDVYYSLTADTSTYDDEMRDLNLVEKAEVQVEPETEVKVQTDKILSGDTVGIELTGWSNLAGSESTTLHVDPANIITMGWGVVPDGGVKVNGKLVKPKDFAAHKLTSESNLDKVDTSGAYKRVNGVTYKRSDYTSDEYFSKAIYSGFYASAKSKVKNFDKLTDAGKEVVVDFGYNGGELFFNFNDTATLVTELIKPEAERNLKELTKFTQNFSMQGVGNTIGVLRRRAVMANKILGSKDQIAYIEQTKLANKNTIFSMKRADGTEVNKWLKLEKHTVDSPAGMPIVNIEGERMSKYIAPKSASVDLTNWAEAIT